MFFAFASALPHDAFDGPEIATLSVAVLGLIGSLATVIITNRGRQHSKVVREQVENEHQQSANPNLREDIDAKHEELARKLDKVGMDVRFVKDDVAILRVGWQTNRSDIDDLMDTDSRRRHAERTFGPPPQTRRDARGR